MLDALDVERVAVFGYSAGGPSALQFALRHPDRTTALVLLAPPLPGKTGRPPRLLGQVIFGSDLFFWALKTYMPGAFARMLGMPTPFPTTDDERAILNERGADRFPSLRANTARSLMSTSPPQGFRRFGWKSWAYQLS